MFPFLKFYVHIVAVTVYSNSQNPPVARARSRSVAPPGIPARRPHVMPSTHVLTSPHPHAASHPPGHELKVLLTV